MELSTGWDICTSGLRPPSYALNFHLQGTCLIDLPGSGKHLPSHWSHLDIMYASQDSRHFMFIPTVTDRHLWCTSLVMLTDPESMGIVVWISLLTCIQVEITMLPVLRPPSWIQHIRLSYIVFPLVPCQSWTFNSVVFRWHFLANLYASKDMFTSGLMSPYWILHFRLSRVAFSIVLFGFQIAIIWVLPLI